MKHLRFLACLSAFALVSAPGVLAQMSQSGELTCLIEGFSQVSSQVETLQLVMDSGNSPVEAVDSVVYETNQEQQTVFVHVEGDLTGLEVRVEPALETQSVLGMALSGRMGHATPVVFQSAGTLPLVTDITGSGVELDVRYTVVALDPQATGRARDIRITYSMF